jgi:RHS repeat-associated protein
MPATNGEKPVRLNRRRSRTHGLARASGYAVQPLEGRVLLSTVTWAGGTGTWETAADWSGGQLPASTDDVVIPAGSNVTESGGQTINGLTTAAGSTLTVNGGLTLGAEPSTVSGTLALNATLAGGAGTVLLEGTTTWSNGSIIIGGALTNTGTFTTADGNGQNIDIQSGPFINTGTFNFGGLNHLGIHGGNGGIFDNRAGGTFDIRTSAAFVQADSGGVFTNEGTLEQTAGTGSQFHLPFTNSGTISVQTGTLYLGDGGGGANPTLNGGTYSAAAGATLDLTGGGTATFTGTLTGSGAGTVAIAEGGTLQTGAGGGVLDFPAGLFQLDYGGLAAPQGTLTNTGTININNTSNANQVSLADGPIVNQGVITAIGGFLIHVGGTLDNQAGATLDLQGDASITQADTGGSLTNEGTLEQTAGTGSQFHLPFTNSGTISVQTGTLYLGDGGGGANPTLTGGTYSAAAGATLDLTGGGAATFTGTLTGSGAGTVVIAGNGTLQTGAGGGTLDFPAGLLQLDDGGLAAPQGTLTNAGTITINNTGNDNQVNLAEGPIVNQGMITEIGGGFYVHGGGTLDNQAGATLDLQGDATITQADTGGTLTNEGLIEKTSGTGNTVLQLPFTNTGTMDVASGMVTIDYGTLTGGAYSVAAGSDLELAPQYGTTTLTGAFTMTDAGTVSLTGGTLDIGTAGATFDCTQFDFDAGEINLAPGGTTLDCAQFDWDGGTLNGAMGNLTNAGTIDIDASTSDVFLNNDGTIFDQGTIVETGTAGLNLHGDGVSPTTLDIEAGGTYEIGSDVGIDNQYGGATALINQGTITKTAGTGTSTLTIDGTITNTGTIDAASGTLDLEATTVAEVSGGTLSAGTWKATGGGSLAFPQGTAITTNGGSVTLGGAGASIPAVAGLSANSGSLTVTGGATFATTGNLGNTGTLVVGPSSTVTVKGTYTQGSAATLDVQLGGAPAAAAFGTLATTGAATLNGTLQADLVDGYVPTAGDTFPVLTFASTTGAFATFDLPTEFVTRSANTGLSLLAATSGTGGGTGTGGGGTVVSSADLAVGSIDSITPATATVGQSVTVDYTVTDVSGSTGIASWTDSVFLSPGQTLGASSTLIARATHQGALTAAGQAYQGTLTAVVPGVLPGDYYVIVEADSGDAVSDPTRANNVLASTTTLLAQLPALALAAVGATPTAVTGTVAAGQQLYYELTLPGGGDAQVTLATGTAGGAELLELYRSLPTAGTFANESDDAAQTTQQVALANVQAGNYYLLVVGTGASTTFSLTAQALGFQVTGISPTGVLNTDPLGTSASATLTIHGSLFTPASTVALVDGSAAVPATRSMYQSASTLFATFDYGTLASGTYPVQVTTGGQTATYDGFTVTRQSIAFGGSGPAAVPAVNPLRVTVSAPSAVRANTVATVEVRYANTGSTDLPAPILALSGDGATFAPVGSTTFSAEAVFLADNPGGPAGTLPPGFSGTLTFQFTESKSASIGAGVLDSATPIPLATVTGAPALADAIPSVAMAIVTANLAAYFGTAVPSDGNPTISGTQYQAGIDGAATYLSQLGIYTTDIGELNALILNEADDYGAISQRYVKGSFGLGTPSLTVTAAADSAGYVSITSGAGVEQFSPLSDGGYAAAPGDFSSLALVNGAYQLVSSNGTVEVFNTDGTLHSVQPVSGDELVYAYSGSNLTSITDTVTGLATAYTYNSSGEVTQETDPDGQVTTYAYDATGQFLASQQGPQGTTTYQYDATPGAAAYGAIESITYPDGTQAGFTYDGEGRVATMSGTGGADATALSYADGEVSETNALGQTQSQFIDAYGSAVESVDALGNVSAAVENGSEEATNLVLPGNVSRTAVFDSLGNPTSVTNAAGETSSATFNAASELLSLTDALGNTTTFTHDALGQTTGVAYPNGTDERYAYAAAGTVSQFIDASGAATDYSYDAQGQLTGETFADGTADQFGYDADGNLTSATDASGTTQLARDAAGELTQVTYPDGDFIRYAYNALGQRTQMSDQTGFAVNYTYDALGRIATLTDASGAPIVTYAYNAAGQLADEQFGNGTASDYTYDADGDVLSITNLASGGATQSSEAYTYNAQGLPITMTTSAGQFAYAYDVTGQLTSVTTPAGQTIVYEYDAAGTRAAVVTDGTPIAYTTNDMNQYTAVGGTTYTYDADGDLVSSADSTGTTTYQYDALNRLTGITSPSGTTTYRYDALGDLVAEDQNGQVTDLLVDPTGPGMVFGQFTSAGGAVDHYVDGNGLVSSVSASGNTAYYDFDATGNTVQLTGTGGAVLDTYAYLPFGEQMPRTGTDSNPFAYVGQYGALDGGQGLIFMRNRWYSPSLGRFMSPDPTGLDGGDANLYRYAHNSPIDVIDPTGTADFTPAIIEAGLTLVPNSYQNFFTAAADRVNAGLPITVAQQTFLKSVLDRIGSAGLAGADEVAAARDTVTNYANVVLRNLVTTAGATGYAIRAALSDALFDGLSGIAGAEAGLTTLPVVIAVGEGTAVYVGTHAALEGTGFDAWFSSKLAPLFEPPYQPVFVGTDVPHDPNNIIGPAGFGAAAYIGVDAPAPYQIDFENASTAAAAAAVVTVTERLDPGLDWTTFQLGTIGFGSFTVDVPAGLMSYATRVEATSTLGVYVDVAADFDPLTGLATWTLTALDPTTLDVPSDPTKGVLPPDVTSPEGEGFVDYTVTPKSSDVTGTVISAAASIVFDTNAAIATPTVTNTISATPPGSAVLLPATEATGTFTVTWAGSDAGGPGIADYDVYVSTDGGAFQPFLTGTTARSAPFEGATGHTYAFYSIAHDLVGNAQALPTSAAPSTQVEVPTRFITFGGKTKAAFTDAAGNGVTVSLSGPGSGQVGFVASGNADPVEISLTGTTRASRVTVTVRRGTLALDDVAVTGSLSGFTANTSDLDGQLAVTGTLGSLSLAAVTGPYSTITVGAAGVATTYRFGDVQDLALTSAAEIRQVVSGPWSDGTVPADSVTAPSIASVDVKGTLNASLDVTGGGAALGTVVAGTLSGGTWTVAASARTISVGAIQSGWSGTFGGNVTTFQVRGTEAGFLSAASVGSVLIGGELQGGQVLTTGDIRAVSLGGATGSQVFAGVSDAAAGLPSAASGFSATSTIGSLTVKGSSPFSDSDIAAADIGTATLRDVATTNGGQPFGVAAESLGSLSLDEQGRKPFHWTGKDKVSLLAGLPGDFKVDLL